MGTSRKISQMEWAFTSGLMVKSTRVNGRMGSKKAMAFGKGFLAIPTSVNGNNRKQMDTVFTSGRMGTDTKVSGRIASSMAKALICLLWVMFTLASTNSANLMDSVSINGKTEALIQVSFKTV